MFINKKREGIDTFVCAVSLYVAETPKASIKAHELQLPIITYGIVAYGFVELPFSKQLFVHLTVADVKGEGGWGGGGEEAKIKKPVSLLPSTLISPTLISRLLRKQTEGWPGVITGILQYFIQPTSNSFVSTMRTEQKPHSKMSTVRT